MKEYAAVYQQREDGDWDVMVVFATDRMIFVELLSQASGARNMAEELVIFLKDNGEEAKIIEFDSLREIPDVWVDKKSE
jgi:hypothetical protein